MYPANEPYFSVLCITSDLVAVVTDNWTVQSNDVVILELGFSLSSRFAGVVVCLFVFILLCFCYLESSDWLLAAACADDQCGCPVTNFTDLRMVLKDPVFQVYLSAGQREEQRGGEGCGHTQSLGIYLVAGKGLANMRGGTTAASASLSASLGSKAVAKAEILRVKDRVLLALSGSYQLCARCS